MLLKAREMVTAQGFGRQLIKTSSVEALLVEEVAT